MQHALSIAHTHRHADTDGDDHTDAYSHRDTDQYANSGSPDSHSYPNTYSTAPYYQPTMLDDCYLKRDEC